MDPKTLTLVLLVASLPAAALAQEPCETVRDSTGALIVTLNDSVLTPVERRDPVPTCAAMNLTQLGRRVRDTPAIGMFTKLAFYGEIQEFVRRMKLAREGGSRPSEIAEMRREFDRLFNKAASKVQEGDPQLSSDIRCNKDRLWDVVLTKDLDD